MINELMDEHEREVDRGTMLVTFTQDKDIVRTSVEVNATGDMVDSLIVELLIKRAEIKEHRLEDTLAEITVFSILEAVKRAGKI